MISEHSPFQYIQLVDRHACQKRRTPEFRPCNFFGQLKYILVLEILSTPQLNLATPMTAILALIHSVKATQKTAFIITVIKIVVLMKSLI